MWGGTGLVRCDGTFSEKSGCANNAASEPHEVVLNASGVGSDTPDMGGSALSIYANGSGRVGAVSKVSVHANGEPASPADTAESGCDVPDVAGVVARVDQPSAGAEESGLVPLPLPKRVAELKEELSGSASPTGGTAETVNTLPSTPRLPRLSGRRRGSSSKLSGSIAGPCKKLATATDAVLYNHARGKASALSAGCSARPSKKCFREARPDKSGTGSPTRALPLLMDMAVSRRLVYPSPSRCGGSISMSCMLDRSMTMSPLIAQPPVPYPPALMDGDSPCVLQNLITLQKCRRGHNCKAIRIRTVRHPVRRGEVRRPLRCSERSH